MTEVSKGESEPAAPKINRSKHLPESARYRDFMGWEMPWYSAQDSLDTLLVGSGGHDAHRLLPAARIQCLRDARLDRVRAAGDVGGLADRLATTVYRQPGYAYRWTSHRPVGSPEGRVFRRPRNRQGLNRKLSFCSHGEPAPTESNRKRSGV